METDICNNTNFGTTTLYSFDNTTDFSTIPNALIAYARDTVFSTWQSLERQLTEVADPEMRKVLDQKAESMFYIWLQFRGV
jgi:hypothetical protein